ncbi:MAG: GldG family protein, partial [bacterium]|nr:GldG family protein [bacterium]
MTSSWLKARQTKYTFYVTVYVVVVVAVLSIASFLGSRHNKSIDFTENKRYSLADQTLKILGGLEQDVQITIFDQSSRIAAAKDLLDRYDNASAKVSVEYVDPDKKPQVARAEGVRTYGAVFVKAGVNKEEAKSLTEEEVTNALIRALKGGPRTVCLAQGNGEHGLDDFGRMGYSAAKELLENSNYTTKTFSLIETAEVPSDCTIVMVGGPRFDYLEPHATAIKNFVEQGGRAMVLLGAPVQFGEDNIASNEELTKVFDGWGVKVSENLIFDTNPVGRFFGVGPFVPLVSQYETHDIVRDLREVATAFPMSRTLETSTADNVTVDKLFSSGGNSYATTDLTSQEIDPANAAEGPFALAVAGKVTVSAGEEPEQTEEEEPAEEETSSDDEPEGRFVVVGSSEWLANNYVNLSGNSDMFLNMIAWLGSDEELISIRPKDPEDRRLEMTGSQMRWIF